MFRSCTGGCAFGIGRNKQTKSKSLIELNYTVVSESHVGEEKRLLRGTLRETLHRNLILSLYIGFLDFSHGGPKKACNVFSLSVVFFITRKDV